MPALVGTFAAFLQISTTPLLKVPGHKLVQFTYYNLVSGRWVAYVPKFTFYCSLVKLNKLATLKAWLRVAFYYEACIPLSSPEVKLQLITSDVRIIFCHFIPCGYITHLPTHTHTSIYINTISPEKCIHNHWMKYTFNKINHHIC